jgi:hypothetical protein
MWLRVVLTLLVVPVQSLLGVDVVVAGVLSAVSVAPSDAHL